jgi:Holliday junction DNA helicase RuvA
MIGSLKGVVEAVGQDEAVIDVNGVGYLVGAGSHTLQRLEPGASAHLHIETYVREDAFKLFGFLTETERAWFVRLQEIQGVGAKAALAILDALGPEGVADAAALGDKSAFGRAKGVGPKLAGRLALELKDKPPPMGRSFSAGLAAHPVSAPSAAPAEAGAGAMREDAVSALINLGYPESSVRQAVATVLRAEGADATLDALIRLSLKELAP